jgi:hypothetical protein
MIIALPREQESIILIPMAKKEYLSPEMKEVKISSQAILSGSICTSDAQGGGTGPGACDPCDDDDF